MPLTGTYSRNLDEKYRLAVPKGLREGFAEKELTCLYIAPGTDQSLLLYSPSGFDALADRFAEHSSSQNEVRNYLRLFYARAAQVDLDAQGRIRIPERLVEFAGLRRETVLIGVHDHVEIWDSQLWEAFLTRHGAHFDELARRALQ